MFSSMEEFKQYLTAKYGFNLNRKRMLLLEKILQKRCEINRFEDVNSYLQCISQNEDHPEWESLIDRLTIPETYFFRNKGQFDFLEQQIIPELMKNLGSWHWNETGAQLPEIRVLSAGCSTGEEPYSIAISFLEKIKYARSWKILIDAIDISVRRLRKAKQGSYLLDDRMKTSLNEMNPEYLPKYFELGENGDCCLKKFIRDMIVYKKMNLKQLNSTPSSQAKYHIIFCRNVLIYFNPSDHKTMIPMLESLLKPSGYLMMGDAEPLHLYDHHLKLIESNTGLIYQKPATSEKLA